MTVTTLLARQAGVITRQQALAAGFTRHSVDHRVRLRYWWPLHPQVYLVGGHAHTPEAAARAAVLWAGEGAVLDGPAAAWWHGLLAEPPPMLGVTRPTSRPAGARPTVTVRRRDLDPLDVVTVRGLAVTSAPLTVLDAAAALRRPDLVDHALRRGLGGEELQAAHDRLRGAPGSGTTGRLLAGAAQRSADAGRRRLVRLLGGASGWVPEWPLPVPGVAHPAARIVVLVDGWADCVGSGGDEVLRRAGWTVLRFTAADVAQRSRAVLAAIARALADRR